MVQVGSLLIGVVVGVICGAIFALVIRRGKELKVMEVIKVLQKLIYFVLGGGVTNYVVFQALLKRGSVENYMIGIAVGFLPIAILVLVSYFGLFAYLRRRP